MSIVLQCPSCGVQATAPDAAAGKTVRCPKCKTRFSAKSRASESIRAHPLDDRSTPFSARSAMPLWGWFAIGGGGVLVVVLIVVAVVIGTSGNGTPNPAKAPPDASRAATKATAPPSTVAPSEASKPSSTPDPGPASVPPSMPEPKPTEADQKKAEEPYDLKGDRLGMSLQEFKMKYRHKPQGDSREAPFCSDRRDDAAREKDPNPFLGEQAWHPKAKIVNARITFPFEDLKPNKYTPTLAGIKATLHFYGFIDDRLYVIDYVFPHSGFAKIEEAMVATYGKPKTVLTKEYQNAFGARFPGVIGTWDNGVSGITLTERFNEMRSLQIRLIHHELGRVAESRRAKFQKPVL